MNYTAYPDGNDVIELLKSAEIDACGMDLSVYADDAVAIWEQETGYKPFFQTSEADVDFYFDPPGPNRRHETRGGAKLLELARGFVSIASVTVGITPDDAVGEELTAGDDYRLLPYNAVADSVPYTAIEFTVNRWGPPRSIKVSGLPGYCATEIPADAWNAIRKLAASLASTAIKEGLSQGMIEFSEDDVKERYSIELIAKFGSTWNNEARRVMRRYTLMTRY